MKGKIMDKRQKNKIAMYRTVNTYLSDNSNIISGNEEFLNHKDSLDQTIKEIKLKEDIRNKAIKGKTTEKKVTREIVTNKALAIAGALYNFAKKKGDQQMMASTKFTKTRFTQLRDVELSIELNSISEKAVEISTEILKFGISQDKLDSFLSDILTYSAALGVQDTGVALRKGAHKSLKTLFEDADNLLDSLDRFTENYKDSNEAFYAGYKTARVIKDLGYRKRGEAGEGEDNQVNGNVSPEGDNPVRSAGTSEPDKGENGNVKSS